MGECSAYSSLYRRTQRSLKLGLRVGGHLALVPTLAQMNHSELSRMAGAVDDSTINIVVVIIIIIIIRIAHCTQKSLGAGVSVNQTCACACLYAGLHVRLGCGTGHAGPCRLPELRRPLAVRSATSRLFGPVSGRRRGLRLPTAARSIHVRPRERRLTWFAVCCIFDHRASRNAAVKRGR